MPVAPHFQLWPQNLLQTLSNVLWGLFCSPTTGFNPGLRVPKLEDFSFCSPPSKVLLICNQMLNWWFKAMPEKRYIPGGWKPGPQKSESGDKSSGLRRKECSNWGGQSLSQLSRFYCGLFSSWNSNDMKLLTWRSIYEDLKIILVHFRKLKILAWARRKVSFSSCLGSRNINSSDHSNDVSSKGSKQMHLSKM